MNKNLVINIVYENDIMGQAVFDSCGTTDEAYKLLKPVVDLYNDINTQKIKSAMLKMTMDLYSGTINEKNNPEKAALLLQASGAELASVDEIDPLIENELYRIRIPLFFEKESNGKIYLKDFKDYNPEDYLPITLDFKTGMVSFHIFKSEDANGMESKYDSMDDYGLDLDYFDATFIDDIGEVIQNLPLIGQGKIISKIEGE